MSERNSAGLATVLTVAADLASEDGANSEYDRALVELIVYAFGFNMVGKQLFLGTISGGTEFTYDPNDDWEKLPEPRPWEGLTEERWATLATRGGGNAGFFTLLTEPSRGLCRGRVLLTPIEGTWKMAGEE